MVSGFVGLSGVCLLQLSLVSSDGAADLAVGALARRSVHTLIAEPQHGAQVDIYSVRVYGDLLVSVSPTFFLGWFGVWFDRVQTTSHCFVGLVDVGSR